MPRSVPTINGTPTVKEVSIRYIDNSGDKRSVLYKADAAITNATIEAHVSEAAAASQANVYEVHIREIYRAVEDATLALAGEQNSVYDQAILLFKTPAGATQSIYLPAPLESIMEGNTDNVDTANALYTAWRNTAEAMLANAFEPVSVRYTERHEFNSDRKPA